MDLQLQSSDEKENLEEEIEVPPRPVRVRKKPQWYGNVVQHKIQRRKSSVSERGSVLDKILQICKLEKHL